MRRRGRLERSSDSRARIDASAVALNVHVRRCDRDLCAAEVAAIYDETRGLRIVSWQEVEPS